MASLTTLFNRFCDRTLIDRQAAYVTGTTPAARQYTELMRFVGDELLSNPNGWSQLKRLHYFTTVLDVANYQLPGDFYRPLVGTQWSVTNQIQILGPYSDQRVAYQTFGVAPVTPFAGSQINSAQNYIISTSPYTKTSAGYFQIIPPGQNNTDQNVIAYISRNWIWPKNWVATTAYSLGDKVTGINNIYICTTAGTSGTTRPSVTSGTETDGTVTWTVYTEPYEPAADTDICLFDDDLMVEGMRWAWYQAKKQPYEDLKAQWEGSVRTAIGRFNGNGVVNAGEDPNFVDEWPSTPIGSWNV